MEIAIAFLIGFAIGTWAYRKHKSDPDYFRNKAAAVVEKFKDD